MNNSETVTEPGQAGQRRNTARNIILLLILAGLIAGGIFMTQARLLAAPAQPIAYSHQTHVEAGIQCLYCHAQATRSTIAGIPSVERCMGCHNVIATDDEAVLQLAGYWERGEAIPWARVNQQPDFVYFSHQPHLGAGLNCETCHGDVGTMDTARPTQRMDMGWCLRCHLEQGPEEVGRLVDCIACHK